MTHMATEEPQEVQHVEGGSCPCGWKAPTGLRALSTLTIRTAIEAPAPLGIEGEVVVKFQCPVCKAYEFHATTDLGRQTVH
jgi:hypothetical protein